MSSSKSEKVKGFLRYSVAHHPICWQYRDHLIRIRGWSLCLGCTGFYSGFILGGITIFLGVFTHVTWEALIFLAIVFSLPTMFRLVDFSFFNSSDRRLRIVFRGFLGLGIVIGIYSIFVAPSFEFQFLQVLLGLVFYAGITVQRIRSGRKEWDLLCATCSFSRNTKCPGMERLFTWQK
ncbi:MAG: hypothetical protein ACFFB2_06220 [Promethearchaeota archaeon]